jgi:hypothetical protein
MLIDIMYYLCYILYAFEYYVTILYKYVTVHLYSLFTAGERSQNMNKKPLVETKGEIKPLILYCMHHKYTKIN